MLMALHRPGVGDPAPSERRCAREGGTAGRRRPSRYSAAAAPRRRRIAGVIALPAVAAMLALAAAAVETTLGLLQQARWSVSLRREREIAFRAAEAALADAELALSRQPADTADAADPAHRLAHAQPPRWQAWLAPGDAGLAAIGTEFGAQTGLAMPALAPDIPAPRVLPRYLIEARSPAAHSRTLPPGTPRYRITAIGFGTDPSVHVVLQTEWAGAPPAAAAAPMGAPTAAPTIWPTAQATAHATATEHATAQATAPPFAQPPAAPIGRLAWRELIPLPQP